MMFGEQMVQLVTRIFKCQVTTSMLTLSLLSLKRFIISHYQVENLQSVRTQRKFRILKLQSLSPKGLNISLNYPQNTTLQLQFPFYSDYNLQLIAIYTGASKNMHPRINVGHENVTC